MSALRLSRLRKDEIIRDWISQTELTAGDIILPYFVVEGENVSDPIESMPGVRHLSVDNLIKDISGNVGGRKSSGIRAVLLFGLTGTKDETGSEGYNEDGALQNAIRTIKKEYSDMVVITDVCMCGYTSHGHCGVITDRRIDNDATLDILSKIALSHAEAGADLVAPSAMMDGQVGAIRKTLDKNEFKDVGIMAYSAKYASNFYGPFRNALNSVPQFGDRKTYQMDFRNSDEAIREIKQDIAEGADIVMVKPALAYLDIICRARREFNVPVAAYNVSGEYSMVKKMADGDRDMEKDLAMEILMSIKRAGADLIITYFGKEAAEWLK